MLKIFDVNFFKVSDTGKIRAGKMIGPFVDQACVKIFEILCILQSLHIQEKYFTIVTLLAESLLCQLCFDI